MLDTRYTRSHFEFQSTTRNVLRCTHHRHLATSLCEPLLPILQASAAQAKLKGPAKPASRSRAKYFKTMSIRRLGLIYDVLPKLGAPRIEVVRKEG